MSPRRSSLEPRRWSEATSDAPEALRAALQDARDTNVGSERVARLAERLGVDSGAAAGVGLSSVGAAGLGTASAVVSYKLWAYLSGVVAVSAVSIVMWSSLGPLDALDAHAAVATADVQDVLPSVADRDAPAVLQRTHPSSAPLPVIARAKPSVDVSRPVAHLASRRRLPTSADGPATETARGSPDPQAELTILNRAQDALAQAPRRALTLAEDHARAFPRGVFAQEREVIAIEALIKLQRSDDATARGRAFLATFPTSTHAPRVQHMLGE